MFPLFSEVLKQHFKQMDNQIPEKTKRGHLRFLELKKREILERN